MLISNRWSLRARADALPTRVDGSRSQDTKKQRSLCFFATATYAASEPIRGVAGLSVPGNCTCAISAWVRSRFGVPLEGRAVVTTNRGGCRVILSNADDSSDDSFSIGLARTTAS